MDKINFGGKSVKNIPFGSRKEYSKQLTHSLRKTIQEMGRVAKKLIEKLIIDSKPLALKGGALTYRYQR